MSLVFLTLAALAQSVPAVAPPASPAATAGEPAEIVTFDLAPRDGPVLEVLVDGQPVALAVDTERAQSAFVESATAPVLSLPGEDGRAIAATSGRSAVGFDLLAGHRLDLDLAQGLARVSAKDKAKRGLVAVALDTSGGQAMVRYAKLGNVPANVVLATGRPLTLGNRALHDALAKAGPLVSLQRGVARGDGGRPVAVDLVLVPQVLLGDVGLANVPVAFVDGALEDGFGDEAAPMLLLGRAQLEAFPGLALDFRKGRALFALQKGQGRAPGDGTVEEIMRRAQVNQPSLMREIRAIRTEPH